jgi:AraC family transcriptional regulator
MRAWVERCERNGVAVAEAALGGIGVVELRFPPRYEQPSFDPEHGYLAVVLDGELQKSFPRRTLTLAAGVAATIPVEATHTATFGAAGARILVVKPPANPERPYESLLSGVRMRRDPGLTALARRISGELSASDEAAPVAVEGLAFELVAAAVRGSSGRLPSRRPAWLGRVVEQLHAEPAGSLSLAALAASANVDPAHLGRVFRRHYGVSIGTYLRRLRLDWAAATLTGSDAPLARIAAEHGFSDQSHFTRAFKHHTGVTPARYRRLARRA